MTLPHFLDGLPMWLSGIESDCQFRRGEFYPWAGKLPGRGKCQLTPVFLPGKFHGQWSLVRSVESQRVRHNWVTTTFHTKMTLFCGVRLWLLTVTPGNTPTGQKSYSATASCQHHVSPEGEALVFSPNFLQCLFAFTTWIILTKPNKAWRNTLLV